MVNSGALAVFVLLLMLLSGQKDVIVATTSSLVDTGFLEAIIPSFQKKYGIFVKLFVTGSGQAFSLGRRGEADLLLVHSPEEEAEFIRRGFGTQRVPFMYNHFVLLGPREDPCFALKSGSIKEGLRKISASGCKFLSRGDDSGTHNLEKRLWKEIGFVAHRCPWYEEVGGGMGVTLKLAFQKRAYTISDSGTYLVWKRTFGDKMLSMKDASLINQYSAIPVNPKVSKSIKFAEAKTFLEFLTSDEVREFIKTFGLERYGEPLFAPISEKGKQWIR